MTDKENAAPAPFAQERHGADETVSTSDRELLIREYERRLALLKSGASPGDVIFRKTNESPRTENGTRAISNGWVVTDNGAEIATITMSITTLSGFQEDHIRELLKRFAEASHSFYLEAGNKLKTGP